MTDSTQSPFTAILDGRQPGNILARDDSRRFALIQSLEPEAAVHWLAVPFEGGRTTEELEQQDRQRFLDLIDWTVDQAHRLAPDYPALNQGFTVKFHYGAYETVPHPKLHILSVE
jgi:histidine triad (HIT) family protein